MVDDKDAFKSLAGSRILITGGAGMIGSTIARLAAAAGARVTVLTRSSTHLFNLHEVPAEIVYGDIRELSLISELVSGKDLIFNLAAQASYVDSNNDPFTDLDVNCKGHLTVLEACKRHNPKARLVFSSSRFVYGDVEYNPVDEKHPFNCLSIYGVHKLNGEKYYHFYNRAHGIESLIFRIANPYGPRQQMRHGKYGIVNWFIRQALEGKNLTVYGDGTQLRDYVYVEDLARAMLLGAVARKIKFAEYNVGSGGGLAFKDMAALVAEAVGGVKVEFVAWPKDRYFVETGDYVSDIAKIRRELGWEPKTSIKEGVARTIEYYRRHAGEYGFSVRKPAASAP